MTHKFANILFSRSKSSKMSMLKQANTILEELLMLNENVVKRPNILLRARSWTLSRLWSKSTDQPPGMRLLRRLHFLMPLTVNSDAPRLVQCSGHGKMYWLRKLHKYTLFVQNITNNYYAIWSKI